MQKFLALLLSVLVLFSFASCTNSGDSSSGSQNSTISVFSELSSFPTESEDVSSSKVSKPQDNIHSSQPASSDISSSGSSFGPSTVTSTTPPTSSSGTSSDTVSSNSAVIPTNPSGEVSSENYICYSRLNSNQKIIYNALLSACVNMQTSWIDINLPSSVKFRDISLAFFSLETDHPELFWIPHQYYTKISSNKVQFLFLSEEDSKQPNNSTYLIKKSQQAEMVAELKAEIEKIKSLVTATNPYEIELQLHDILCERITYAESDSSEPMLWTVYGALVNRTAVCEGYARAFQLLLYEFGINSTLATGLAGGTGHMWNVVNINDGFYHVDLTWDDREDGGQPSFHAFFNLTDTEVQSTHNPHPDFALIKDSAFDSGDAVSYNFNLHECNDNSLNYFNVTGFIFSGGDEEALADHIISVGGNVEYKFIGVSPNLTAVNSFLRQKNSKLRALSWVQKPSADVIILEVEG